MRHTPRPLHALLLVLLLTIGPAPAAPAPALAQQAVTAEPAALSATVVLGETAARSLRVSGAPGAFSPTIYEALAAEPKALAAGPKRAELPRQPDRLDTRIAQQAAAAPDGAVDFLIVLGEQADLGAAYGIRDWGERGRYVERALREHAARTQAPLMAALAARGLPATSLWVVNAVRVRGTAADAQALVGRSDVAALRANRTLMIAPEAEIPAAKADEDRCSPDAPGNPVCWNIRQIGAPRVWQEFGVDGAGVTVANIDTGVAFDHQALQDGYRGRRGAALDHSYSWFDPQGSAPAPSDSHGHGTHTMSTMVGRGGGTSGWPAVGVAPGASWIAAEGCSGFACSEFDLMAAAQWLLAPTDLSGQNPRPDLRPMVVNNSWGGLGGNDWYAGYTAAWRAAGIFPVFAAGNTDSSRSQACGTVSSPGDYADVVQVGATDATDGIASFSLLGPTADGRMKPDFSAPGVHTSGQFGVWGATNESVASYRTLSGTSMAAPHVAGVVALLWSANPGLIGDYDATYAILRDTALRLSDTRCGDAPGAPNSVFGNGRVDAYAAVARARVDVPWLALDATQPAVAPDGSATVGVTLRADRVPGPGTYSARLQVFGAGLDQAPTSVSVSMTVTAAPDSAIVRGRLYSSEGGAPLQGSVGITGGLPALTDATGVYTLTLRAGSHSLTASASSYVPAVEQIAVAAGTVETRDIVLLPDQPRASLASQPISAALAFGEERTVPVTVTNTGRRTLYYSADAPAAYFSVWRSDSGLPDAPVYEWVDLPPDAPQLALTADGFAEKVPLGIDFPFYSYTLTDTLVTADGMLTFDTLYGYAGPATRCFPAEEVGFYVIAALRADLDPSAGGAVRYGTVGGTFVLSYEGVPREGGAPGETYSFQTLLRRDGRLVFQYKQLGAITSTMSSGVQRTPWDYQEIGCGGGLSLHDGLAVELRPQPASPGWLEVTSEGSQIAPGQQATIEVALRWVRPSLAGPYRATVRLGSNDPMSPTILLPIEITAAPAPHEQMLLYVMR